MKKICLTIYLLGFWSILFSGFYPSSFDFNYVLRKAAREQKLCIITAYDENSMACEELYDNLKSIQLEELIEHHFLRYEVILNEVGEHEILQERYQLNSSPSLVIIAPDGHVIIHLEGLYSEGELSRTLEEIVKYEKDIFVHQSQPLEAARVDIQPKLKAQEIGIVLNEGKDFQPLYDLGMQWAEVWPGSIWITAQDAGRYQFTLGNFRSLEEAEAKCFQLRQATATDCRTIVFDPEEAGHMLLKGKSEFDGRSN